MISMLSFVSGDRYIYFRHNKQEILVIDTHNDPMDDEVGGLYLWKFSSNNFSGYDTTHQRLKIVGVDEV